MDNGIVPVRKEKANIGYNINYVGKEKEVKEAKEFLENWGKLVIYPEDTELTALVEDRKIMFYPTDIGGIITCSGPFSKGVRDGIAHIGYDYVKGFEIMVLNKNPVVCYFESLKKKFLF